MGCLTDAGTICNLDGGLSTCSAAPNDYVTDDFGNVVEARLANSDNGSKTDKGYVRYQYDELGNVTAESFSDGTTNAFTYDNLGRLLSVTSSPLEAFTLSYDSPGSTPGSCPSITNTMGRILNRTDAHWTTWYSYDDEGHVIAEMRVPIGDTDCPTPSLNTLYTYTDNGNLASVTHPYGRTTIYTYGTGALVDRVASIDATFWVGSWLQVGLIDQVAWEPYGGLRGYRIKHFASSNESRVEYMLGGDSSAAPSSGNECPDTAPSVSSSYDKTARLRSLRVSYGSTSSLAVARKFSKSTTHGRQTKSSEPTAATWMMTSPSLKLTTTTERCVSLQRTSPTTPHWRSDVTILRLRPRGTRSTSSLTTLASMAPSPTPP
ncbi:MAG: RHS repeat protein [Archangiaceae bacterium]|nr:RHS repeat protein [Archangiaceae bacterium]